MSNYLKPEIVRQLHTAYRAGMTLRRAAKMVGCSTVTANGYYSYWRDEKPHEVGNTDPEELAPRYAGGLLLDQRRAWVLWDKVMIVMLCPHAIDLEIISPILGRSPSAIAWQAEAMGLSLPINWRSYIRKQTTD